MTRRIHTAIGFLFASALGAQAETVADPVVLTSGVLPASLGLALALLASVLFFHLRRSNVG